jgi:hypothetical protein
VFSTGAGRLVALFFVYNKIPSSPGSPFDLHISFAYTPFAGLLDSPEVSTLA